MQAIGGDEQLERDEGTVSEAYVVSYWVTFTVEAQGYSEARDKGEAALIEAIEAGTLGDYVSDSYEVDLA